MSKKEDKVLTKKYKVVKDNIIEKEITLVREVDTSVYARGIVENEKILKELDGNMQIREIEIKNYKKANPKLTKLVVAENMSWFKEFVDTFIDYQQTKQNIITVREHIKQIEEEVKNIEKETGLKIELRPKKKDGKK